MGLTGPDNDPLTRAQILGIGGAAPIRLDRVPEFDMIFYVGD
jgi:hypothetical protein